MGAVNGQLNHAGAAGNPLARQREQLLNAAARRTARMRWTPSLLEALLDELYVDDAYFDLLGLGGRRIPKSRYPQAVALALLWRHAWRTDDFTATASKLGLISRRPSARQRARPQ